MLLIKVFIHQAMQIINFRMNETEIYQFKNKYKVNRFKIIHSKMYIDKIFWLQYEFSRKYYL